MWRIYGWPGGYFSDELPRIPIPRTRVNRAKKGYCPLLRALGLVALLDASSVIPHRFGRLCPVVYPKHLVDGAQVLLDRRLRQVQVPGYLGVAQALHHQFQDLSLTSRELPYFGFLLLAQEVVS